MRQSVCTYPYKNDFRTVETPEKQIPTTTERPELEWLKTEETVYFDCMRQIATPRNSLCPVAKVANTLGESR
ncbi:hypothetical protein Q31b_31040 [Novipirellula aureliae]|uniref:Uncharacterized protein n=1 Tax=Novipirellula aureliae TaxID=2527966 RepID=A0A5C6DY85_9BACT|nr:hypothetical protein [Novipirellula aureliae]TWU41650.1 hypothetical protein Q31b_31040 [Novipirellula aureliae]